MPRAHLYSHESQEIVISSSIPLTIIKPKDERNSGLSFSFFLFFPVSAQQKINYKTVQGLEHSQITEEIQSIVFLLISLL